MKEKHFEWILFSPIIYTSVKPVKIFECSCVDGFTGDFCEFKTEQNQLLYLRDYDYLFFNDEGQRIETSFTFDDSAHVSRSCFTMLNGEAVIFGGWYSNIRRQVTNSSVHFNFC